MKRIQPIRLAVQILFFVLFAFGIINEYPAVISAAFILGILGGAFFCGWICPFGTLQDLSSKLGKLLKIKKVKVPRILHLILFPLRYILFGAVSIFSIDFIFSLLSYDPRGNLLALFRSGSLGLTSLIILCIFLVSSLFVDRIFCNYLCIEGASKGLMSILRPVTIKRNQEKCVNCKKCNKVCPMNIDVANSDQLHSPHCINCFNCLSSCPIHSGLSYGKRMFNHTQKKKYALLLVGVLLFFGVKYGYEYISKEQPSKDNNEITEETNDDSTNSKPPISEVPKEDPTPETPSSIYNDGTFTGTGDGFNGPITSQVIIENGVITKVQVIKNRDDAKWFNRANNSIPKKIIEAQSSDVDVVSGATYSSQGIIDSVRNALEKADTLE